MQASISHHTPPFCPSPAQTTQLKYSQTDNRDKRAAGLWSTLVPKAALRGCPCLLSSTEFDHRNSVFQTRLRTTALVLPREVETVMQAKEGVLNRSFVLYTMIPRLQMTPISKQIDYVLCCDDRCPSHSRDVIKRGELHDCTMDSLWEEIESQNNHHVDPKNTRVIFHHCRR